MTSEDGLPDKLDELMASYGASTPMANNLYYWVYLGEVLIQTWVLAGGCEVQQMLQYFFNNVAVLVAQHKVATNAPLYQRGHYAFI